MFPGLRGALSTLAQGGVKGGLPGILNDLQGTRCTWILCFCFLLGQVSPICPLQPMETTVPWPRAGLLQRPPGALHYPAHTSFLVQLPSSDQPRVKQRKCSRGKSSPQYLWGVNQLIFHTRNYIRDALAEASLPVLWGDRQGRKPEDLGTPGPAPQLPA